MAVNNTPRISNVNNANNANNTNNTNNTNNSNGSNAGNNLGNVNNNSLLEEIRALSFVKTELELYLNTHPDCRTALDYYTQTVNALNKLKNEYHNTVGPIVAEGVTGDTNWTWVNTPWPWQFGAGVPNNGREV